MEISPIMKYIILYEKSFLLSLLHIISLWDLHVFFPITRWYEKYLKYVERNRFPNFLIQVHLEYKVIDYNVLFWLAHDYVRIKTITE